jgi:hypothetical protein
MAYRPLSARTPVAWMQKARTLNYYLQKVDHLSHLQRLLELQIQPAARPHCHIASWREGTLLIIVTDGHWATRLRYQQKRLHKSLAEFPEFSNLIRILFKVQPPLVHAAGTSRTVSLNPSAADVIAATADGIEHPGLRDALKRLAEKAKINQGNS